jgi:hypothetical protein
VKSDKIVSGGQRSYHCLFCTIPELTSFKSQAGRERRSNPEAPTGTRADYKIYFDPDRMLTTAILISLVLIETVPGIVRISTNIAHHEAKVQYSHVMARV